jgi:hypothetical protein
VAILTIVIKINELENGIRHTEKLIYELEDYANTLTSRIKNELPSVRGGMSPYLNAADAALQLKITNLWGKHTDALNIDKRLTEVLDMAIHSDREVFDLISAEKKEFLDLNPHLRPPPPPPEKQWYDYFNPLYAMGEAWDGLVLIGEWTVELAKDTATFIYKNGKTILVIVGVTAVSVVVIVVSGGAAIPTLAAISALTSVSGKVTGDIIDNILSGRALRDWKLSAWDEYLTEYIVGGITGIATGCLGFTNSDLARKVFKFGIKLSEPILKFYVESFIGGTEDDDNPFTVEVLMEFAVEYGVGKLSEAFGKKIFGLVDDLTPGTNIYGQYGMKQISDTITTKITNGTVSHISTETIKKMITVKTIEGINKGLSKTIASKFHDEFISPIYDAKEVKSFFDIELVYSKDYGKTLSKTITTSIEKGLLSK